MPVSPGIYVNEFDFSEYGAQLGLAKPLFIGGGSKGPLDTPTLVKNAVELVDKFGPPRTDDYGIQSALQYFKKGDQLVYMRVAGGTDDTPGVAATGTVNFVANPSDGDTITISDGIFTRTFEFDNNATVTAGNTSVTIGGTAALSRTALLNAILASVLAISVTSEDTGDPGLVLTNESEGTAGNVTITETGVSMTVTGMSGGTNRTAGTGPRSATAKVGGYDDTVEAIAPTGYVLFDANVNPADAATVVIDDGDNPAVTFEFDSNSSVVQTATLRQVVIGATAAITRDNFIAAVNAAPALDITASDGTGLGDPRVALLHDNTGTDGNVAITTGSPVLTVFGMSGGAAEVQGVPVSLLMTISALYPGTWGDSLRVVVRASTALNAATDAFDLLVYEPPVGGGALQLKELFTNLSLTASNDRFVETVLTEGILGEVAPSKLISVDVVETGKPNPGTYELGDAPGLSGRDGITALASTDYIGTVTNGVATGLQACRNAEAVEFNILAVPGVSHADVIAEMIDVCESRGDALALIDPPFGLGVDEIKDWHNGLGSGHSIANSPATPLDSNYAALYWAWNKVYDKTNEVNIFLPPSGFVAANMAANDIDAGPWFPVAGHVRGPIDSLETEYSPTVAERDVLVGIGSGNAVNPIVDFVTLGDGPTIYGNRTLQRARTSLADIHVRRLLLHAKKLCATAVRVLTFDPNDAVNWKKFEQLCNPILEAIAARRGLETFQVVCNESTNPVSQRQNKIMRGLLRLKPLDAAEAIVLDFSVEASGVDFSESAA